MKNFFSVKFLFSLAVAALLAGALSPTQALAAEANLVWDRNTESDLVGYRVYRGTLNCSAQGPLQPLLDAFGSQVVVLAPAATYKDSSVPLIDGDLCYEITAYDTFNNESGRSNRATTTVNLNPPLAPQNLGVTVAR